MDWKTWQPKERATLCFIRRGEEILLIQKLRGLGAGKVNGPGGKLEPGETPLQAAIRETQEEIGVTPIDARLHAELSFDFTDGYRLHCAVFIAEAFSGEPRPSDEAIPFWCSISAIPYMEMWQDDALWLPQVLGGQNLRGYFEFDGDRMLSHHVEIFQQDVESCEVALNDT